MPSLEDLLDNRPEAPGDVGLELPPRPQSLQFRHRTKGGISPEEDTVVFPFYWSRLDHPELNGDPRAIVTVTPVGRLVVDNATASVDLIQNTHPVGVLYRTLDDRWYIYNLGLEPMEINVDFHVAIHRDTVDD